MPTEGEWKVIFNSDDSEFGGSNFTDNISYMSVPYPWNGLDNQITIALPGLAGLVLKRQGPSSFVAPKPKRRRAKHAVDPIRDPSAKPERPKAKKHLPRMRQPVRRSR